MSLAAWKAEHYPVDAANVPAEEAVAHSLRKWRGLRPRVLERFGNMLIAAQILVAPRVYLLERLTELVK